MITAVVLADTHLRTPAPGRGGGRWLPGPVAAALRRADVVLHAGDLLDAGVLERLGREVGSDRPRRSGGTAPAVHAVLGNNDVSLAGRLPERLVLEIEGVRIG